MATDLIISYRNPVKDHSEFINFTNLLKGKDFDEILKVYEYIFKRSIGYEIRDTEKLKEIEKKLFSKALELIGVGESSTTKVIKAVCSLGIYPQIQKKRKERLLSIHYPFKRYLKKLESVYLEKQIKVHDIDYTVLELMQKRFANPQDELERLMNYPRIAKSLNLQYMSDEHKIVYGHTLELQESLKENYFVFNHGQNLFMMAVNIFTKKLRQLFEVDRHIFHEELRAPVFLNHLNDLFDPEYYQQKLQGDITDDYFRNELICADLYLESNAAEESAISFFAHNKNFAIKHESFLHNLTFKIAKDYFPDHTIASNLTDELLQIVKTIKDGGNLYSICVPKDKFLKIGFLSKAYGFATHDIYTLEDMENYQSGLNFKTHFLPSEKTSFGMRIAPQVRILTSKMKPENGVFVIRNSTMQEEDILNIEKKVDLVILKAIHKL